jgi:hypothetical protein
MISIEVNPGARKSERGLVPPRLSALVTSIIATSVQARDLASSYSQLAKWYVKSLELLEYTKILLTLDSQPPKQAKADSRATTLLFKKHKTTVLLSLQPHEPLAAVKEKLLEAFKSRNMTEVNGEPVPSDPTLIEFGVPVDRSDLEKGWNLLPTDETKATAGRKASSGTILAAGLASGHLVAFRFRKPGDVPESDEVDRDIELNDPGWDVVIPSFDDEEE